MKQRKELRKDARERIEAHLRASIRNDVLVAQIATAIIAQAR